MSKLDALTGNTYAFAAACFDTGDVDQLTRSLRIGADATDCKEWDITEEQWVTAVEAAIHDLSEQP